MHQDPQDDRNLSRVPPWIIDPTTPPATTWNTRSAPPTPLYPPPPTAAVGDPEPGQPQDQHRNGQSRPMRRFTRETPQATQSGYSPHSAQAQTHAQDWHKQQQQELLNQKMAEFTAQRVLHYYGNFSHPSNTVPPILVKAAPDIVRSTKAGLLIRNLYNPPGTTDHHVTLLPWHRVHELILHPNDPLHRDL